MEAEAEAEGEEGAKLSIYKAARSIKRRENSLYNALRSIYQDSIFVSEISLLWPQLPLLANLRCGLWYSRPAAFHSTCYFKSTDGHTNNCSFTTARLNLHVALLAGTLSLSLSSKTQPFSSIFIWVGRTERRLHHRRFHSKRKALP